MLYWSEEENFLLFLYFSIWISPTVVIEVKCTYNESKYTSRNVYLFGFFFQIYFVVGLFVLIITISSDSFDKLIYTFVLFWINIYRINNLITINKTLFVSMRLNENKFTWFLPFDRENEWHLIWSIVSCSMHVSISGFWLNRFFNHWSGTCCKWIVRHMPSGTVISTRIDINLRCWLSRFILRSGQNHGEKCKTKSKMWRLRRLRKLRAEYGKLYVQMLFQLLDNQL